MNTENLFILGLDFEIFFGSDPGTTQNCLIEPTKALLEVADETGLKLSLFVDAGHLIKLGQLQHKFAHFREELAAIRGLLKKLVTLGHDVQLHIHPHWQDSTFDDNKWKFDYSRYRLHAFSPDEITEIVKSYKAELELVTEKPVVAYRAGGWCIQPFNVLAEALRSQGVWLDSTLYRGGYNPDPGRFLDFRNMPSQPAWRFTDDPLVVDDSGYFMELPISDYPISPIFFWEMAIYKKLWRSRLQSFGDGHAMSNQASYYLKRLMSSTVSPVSIDGIKGVLLERAYRYHQKVNPNGAFNVMGHPKSLSRQSLLMLKEFLTHHPELTFATFSEFAESCAPSR